MDMKKDKVRGNFPTVRLLKKERTFTGFRSLPQESDMYLTVSTP